MNFQPDVVQTQCQVRSSSNFIFDMEVYFFPYSIINFK